MTDIATEVARNSSTERRPARILRSHVHGYMTGCVSVMLLLVVGCGKAPTAKDNSPLAEANQFLLSRDYSAALDSVDKVLVTDPNNYQAHLLRGQINRKRDDLDAAIDDFSRARDIEPAKPDAYDFRYQVYLEKSEKCPINSAQWNALLKKASADQDEFYRFDPTSVAARRAATSDFDRSNKVIARTNDTMAELDALEEKNLENLLGPKDDMSDSSGESDMAAEAFPSDVDSTDPLGADLPGLGPDDARDANRQEVAIDERAEQADERAIREQDLASNERVTDDKPLPHGNEADESSDVEVLPQITRNDLGAYLPPLTNPIGPQVGFQPRQPPTTGLNGGQGSTPNFGPGISPGNGQFSTGLTGLVSSPSNVSNLPAQPSRTTGLNASPQPSGASPGISPWQPGQQAGQQVANSAPAFNRPTLAPAGQTGLGATGLGATTGFGQRAGRPNSAPFGSVRPGNGPTGNQFGQPTGLRNGAPFTGPTGFLPGNNQARFGPQVGLGGAASGSQTQENEAEGSRLPKPKKLSETAPVSTALQGTGKIRFGSSDLPQVNPYTPVNGPPTALFPGVKD